MMAGSIWFVMMSESILLGKVQNEMHTVLEKLMEEISFSASERDGEKIIITEDTVKENVTDLAKNADLRKFIL